MAAGTRIIYLKGCADGREAHAGIAAWFGFYNTPSPHRVLEQRTGRAIIVEALGDQGYCLKRFGREETDMLDEEEDTRIYTVVVNHEEQYSIWFANKEIPPGWREVGKQGTKPECLAYVEEVWTDMRPLSLRKSMAERGLG